MATEEGILHEMRNKCKDARFYPVAPELGEGLSSCACNQCDYMKMNTLAKLYNTLKYEWPVVDVDKDIAADAVKPIKRMLSI